MSGLEPVPLEHATVMTTLAVGWGGGQRSRRPVMGVGGWHATRAGGYPYILGVVYRDNLKYVSITLTKNSDNTFNTMIPITIYGG